MASKTWRLGIALTSLMLFNSCMSSPPAQSSDKMPTLRLLDRKAIVEAYGFQQALNPYLTPSGLIGKPPYEFAVVEIAFPSAFSGEFYFDALCLGPDGRQVGSMELLKDLFELWKLWPDSDEKVEKREEVLGRTYVPSSPFKVRTKTRYYAVIRGKYPLPRPSTIVATLEQVGGETIRLEAMIPAEPEF